MLRDINRDNSYNITMKKTIPSNISKRVGENLAAARKALGLTQSQLAKELNKYQSDYSDYETGKVQLDYEKIEFLCKRLDITPNDLFDIV